MVEPDWRALLAALAQSDCVVPASVLTELQLTAASRGPQIKVAASGLIDELLRNGASIAPFEKRHADITAVAREQYGKGNGRGGQLNFGDLMVYAVAKARNEPLLCTGRDFATTDLTLHPASRLTP